MFVTVAPGGFESLFIEIDAMRAGTLKQVAVIEARLGVVSKATQALELRAKG